MANRQVCAMAVEENGNTTLHYVYTDHLGSINAVTNAAGVLEAKLDFDAWGRRRNPVDYSYLPNNTVQIDNGLNTSSTLPAWLYRGYTGHEMLDEFTLINMNARLYDPVLGLMAGVDNVIQAPNYTQNYSRYNYCFNNPLKYTDPSGNWAVWDDAVAMTIGAAFGAWQGYKIGKAQGAEWGNNLLWYTLGGAAIGAAAGEAALYTGGAAAGMFSAGTSAILVGATAGAVGGATAGLINGAGMAYLGGASFDDGLYAGGKGLLIGAASGAVLGAVSGWFSTTSAGQKFGAWSSKHSKGRFFNSKNPYSPFNKRVVNINSTDVIESNNLIGGPRTDGGYYKFSDELDNYSITTEQNSYINLTRRNVETGNFEQLRLEGYQNPQYGKHTDFTVTNLNSDDVFNFASQGKAVQLENGTWQLKTIDGLRIDYYSGSTSGWDKTIQFKQYGSGTFLKLRW